jgi:hypothetical protein
MATVPVAGKPTYINNVQTEKEEVMTQNYSVVDPDPV